MPLQQNGDGSYTVEVMTLNKPTDAGNVYEEHSFRDVAAVFLQRHRHGEFGVPHKPDVASKAEHLFRTIVKGDDLPDPEEPYLRRLMMIDEMRVSHTVTSIRIDDDNKVFCQFKPLETPCGKILKDLMADGFVPKFGMRALVDHDDNGACLVRNIISFDVVNPG